jgi:hypothetical protein
MTAPLPVGRAWMTRLRRMSAYARGTAEFTFIRAHEKAEFANGAFCAFPPLRSTHAAP